MGERFDDADTRMVVQRRKRFPMIMQVLRLRKIYYETCDCGSKVMYE